MSHQQSGAQTASTDSSAASQREFNKRRYRRWLFRGLAICFPLLCVVLIEYGLRWNDVGQDPELVLLARRDTSGLIHHLNPRVDVAYCRDDLRGPEPRGFVLPRPADLVRVIVVGASSVQGYPYPSELSFPRQMELVLQRQFGNRPIEVLNAGIVGLSTTPLVDIVDQCFAASPSVIVLYAGHNEFYDVGGVSTTAQVSPLAIQLRKFRLGQVLSDFNASAEESAATGDSELLARLPTQYRIPVNSPAIGQAAETYRTNVTRIAELCAARDVPLLLCAPVCNLRAQSPLAFQSQLAEVSEFEEIAKSAPGKSENFDLLRKLVSEHPQNAILQFRLAQALESQHQEAEAAVAYSLARDMDPCRYRAPDAFAEILADVVAETGASTTFVDLRSIFARQSQHRVPGDDLFLEHVHFTLDGHSLAARSIARAIVEDVYHQPWSEDRLPSDGERDEWLGMIPEDRLVGYVLAMFLTQSPPFDEAVDSEVHAELLAKKIEEAIEGLTDEDVQCFMSLPHQVKIDDLIDGLGRAQLERGDNERALSLFTLSVKRRPWMPNGHLFSAVCHYQLGNEAEAQRQLQLSRSSVIAESEQLLRDRQRLEATTSRSHRQTLSYHDAE